MMRMAYLRKPEDKKRGSVNPSRQKTPSKSPKPKLPSLPFESPINSFGEDNKSVIRHYNLLQAELRKVVPNKSIVKELMKRTFSTRREEILSECILSTILEKYPALSCSSEVC